MGMAHLKKNIIVIGSPKSGKTVFLDSLTILNASIPGQNVTCMPSTLNYRSNLYGESFPESYNILVPCSKHEIVIQLNLVEFPSINIENMDNFFELLNDENTDFHGIIYFYNGNHSRVSALDNNFLEKLIINYGECILNRLILGQSFSNRILPSPEDCYFERKETVDEYSKEEVNEYKTTVDTFYQDRSRARKEDFLKTIEDTLRKIRSKMSKKALLKMKSIRHVIGQISFLEFGRITLHEVDKKTNKMKITSLPCYDNNFQKAYHHLTRKNCYDNSWVEKLCNTIFSLNKEFNFYKRNIDILNYKEEEAKKKKDLEITIQAIEKTKVKLKENIDKIKMKLAMSAFIDSMPILEKFSPIKISESVEASGITEAGKKIVKDIDSKDIMLVLKNIKQYCLGDEEVEVYTLFIKELEIQKILIKLQEGQLEGNLQVQL